MPDETVTVPEGAVYTDIDLRRDVDRATVARGWVPSAREVAAGAVIEDVQSYVPEEFKVRTRDVLQNAGEQLSFRKLAGAAGIAPVLLLGYSSFFKAILAGAQGFLAPEIRLELGLNLAFFSLASSSIGLFDAALAPLFGYLADRWNRIYILTFGSVIASLGTILTGSAPNIPSYVIAQGVGGAGAAVTAPVGFPILTDYYKPSVRGRMFFLTGACTTAGGVFAPILGGILGGTIGWRGTYISLGAVSAGIALLYLFLKDPVRGKLDREAAGLSPEDAAIAQRPLGWAEGWRAIASVKTLRIQWFAAPFVLGGALQTVFLINIYFFQVYHVPTLTRGLLISATTIPGIVGVVVGGAFTDRLLSYKPGRLVVYGSMIGLLLAVSVALFAYSPNAIVAVLVIIPPLGLSALLSPANQTIGAMVTPARVRGLGIQSVLLSLLVGILMGSLLTAVLGQGDLHPLMISVAVMIAIGALLSLPAAGTIEQDIRAAIASSAADIAAKEAKAKGISKLLVIRDLDVTYDGAQVLFGVDLDVEEGEMLALLGTNGAGKSTLLRAILGIQHAWNGAIYLDGDDITHLPPHQIAQRGVVMMPGGQAVFPTLTVEQNLKTAAWMYRSEEKYVKAKTEEVLELFPRLRERWNALAGNLSGGEQQMVALGQALLMKPRLLMIDELSLGLAPQVVQQLLDALRAINAQGTTVILVEQSINVALQLAKRAVYMEKGEIRFDGSVKELFNRPDVVHSVFLAGAATSGGLARSTQRRLLELGLEEREVTLEVKNVYLQYGGVRVLNGASLELTRGEVVGIIGPNGAGKTSLFDVITGFAKPEAGEIRLLDRDVTGLSPDARARLGLARSYQNVRLFPALTVRENIAVALSRHIQSRSPLLAAVWSPMTRRSERRVARRVDNLVESLGLGTYADKFLNELSTGTRRIVDIACLLAAGPSVLLLDEPSSGLAQAEAEQLGPVIGRIVKETNCSVLVIEHDLGLVASVSHRLIAMRLGEVMAEGPPPEVLGRQDVIDSILGGASDAVISRSIALAGASER